MHILLNPMGLGLRHRWCKSLRTFLCNFPSKFSYCQPQENCISQLCVGVAHFPFSCSTFSMLAQISQLDFVCGCFASCSLPQQWAFWPQILQVQQCHGNTNNNNTTAIATNKTKTSCNNKHPKHSRPTALDNRILYATLASCICHPRLHFVCKRRQ